MYTFRPLLTLPLCRAITPPSNVLIAAMLADIWILLEGYSKQSCLVLSRATPSTFHHLRLVTWLLRMPRVRVMSKNRSFRIQLS